MSAVIPKDQLGRMTPLARAVIENEFVRKRGGRNLRGKTFSRLYVVGPAGVDNCLCLCRCGNYKIVSRSHLLEGAVQSCGCLKREIDQAKARLNQKKAVAGRLAWCESKRARERRAVA